MVRDEIESPNAKFVLKDYDGNINLETDVYKEIYSNEHWNLAVRIKPEDYPIAERCYFFKSRLYFRVLWCISCFRHSQRRFILTASLNYDTGSAYLSNPKRFYVGAHRTNLEVFSRKVTSKLANLMCGLTMWITMPLNYLTKTSPARELTALTAHLLYLGRI